MSVLLKVEKLKVQFKTDRGIVKAVDDVSYYVNPQEIIAIVGESGCGKSVSQLSTLQLIPSPPGLIADGKILFEGQDLLKYEANGSIMRTIRGGEISIIFQEPMTSLNPVLSVGLQLTERLIIHLKLDRQEARKRAIELLTQVGIPSANSRIDDYPHQFSGGMRQRVMIAMALSCNPKLVIADEPTTALDVTSQAQLLEMMKSMVEKYRVSLVIVTHNLGVVARYAQRVYVMYAGRIVESGPSKTIFGIPRHPYTIGLLNCVPRLDEGKEKKLVPIWGMPPSLINMPPTCAFLPRCTYHIKQCETDIWPALRSVGNEHYISCYAEVERNT